MDSWELEQGKSRVVRPELKVGDERSTIYLDWVIADNTIDITKISRLISKIISVAKFENSNNPKYRALHDVEVMKMSLENIFEMNSWATSLQEYSSVYSDLRNLQEQEFANYKEQFIRKYGEDFFFKIKRKAPEPNMKLAQTVPYIEGFSLNGDHLGLERLDNYLSEITLPEDFTPTNNPLVGLDVHTDKGDGSIVRINPKTSSVRVSFGKEQKRFLWRP